MDTERGISHIESDVAAITEALGYTPRNPVPAPRRPGRPGQETFDEAAPNPPKNRLLRLRDESQAEVDAASVVETMNALNGPRYRNPLLQGRAEAPARSAERPKQFVGLLESVSGRRRPTP